MTSSLTQSRNGAFPWPVFAVPGVLAVVIIVLFVISVPGGAAKRVAAIEAKAHTAAEAAGADGDLKTYPAGSVCAGSFTDAMKVQLTSALAATGLKVESLDAGSAGQAATLQAYRFAFKGTGSYDDAMSALNLLRGYKPKLFADTVALRNHIDAVELEVDGRLYCR